MTNVFGLHRVRCKQCAAEGSRGFTYFTVMILVAIMGAGMAAIGTVWHHAVQREKEAELLFIGGEFRRAIGGYFEGSPGGPQYPKSLDDLLKDKRLPVPKPHLRKIYVDPMTGSREWGLVKEPAGGILGVYSKSTRKPLKKARFKEEDKAFSTASTYSDWKFVYGVGTAGVAPAAPGLATGLAAGVTAQEARVDPLAPRTDTASTQDDPGREARRSACEKQREKDAAACDSKGLPSMENLDANACAASAAQRFNSCLEE